MDGLTGLGDISRSGDEDAVKLGKPRGRAGRGITEMAGHRSPGDGHPVLQRQEDPTSRGGGGVETVFAGV